MYINITKIMQEVLRFIQWKCITGKYLRSGYNISKNYYIHDVWSKYELKHYIATYDMEMKVNIMDINTGSYTDKETDCMNRSTRHTVGNINWGPYASSQITNPDKQESLPSIQLNIKWGN